MVYNDPQRDITREMLDTMYLLGKKKRLNEEFDDKIELKDDILRDEEKKFRSTVSPRVEFKTFNIYPKASNVEWSGKFTDTNVEWIYSLDDPNGVYVSGELVMLSDSMMETLRKLVGYYTSWSSDWANKVAEDYKLGNNQQNV